MAISFDEGFTLVDRSPWLRASFGSALDPDLPAEVEPFSFVPLDGLCEVMAALQLRAGESLVDFGCGRGGPGMWLAQQTRAALTGVDGSAVAAGQAHARARLFPLARQPQFVVGDLADTGLPDESADGVVCIDAFQFATDPVQCGREALRVLRPGRRFVLTTWQPNRSGDVDLPDRFRKLDPARMLTQAGFTGIEVRERPGWETRRQAVYEAALAAGDPGDDVALASLQEEARSDLARRDKLRRVLVTAQRPMGRPSTPGGSSRVGSGGRPAYADHPREQQ